MGGEVRGFEPLASSVRASGSLPLCARAFAHVRWTVRGEVRRSDAGLRTGRLCAEGGALRLFASLSSCLRQAAAEQIRIEPVVVRPPTRAMGDACLVGSGWGGSLGGRGSGGGAR